MSILSIVDVPTNIPYLQFCLQLSEHTCFTFKLILTRKNFEKLNIIAGEFNNRVILWQKKINDHMWYIFYYKSGSFHYQNGHEVTEIPVTKDHIKVIDNFILENTLIKTKKRRCIIC